MISIMMITGRAHISDKNNNTDRIAHDYENVFDK